MCRRVSASLGPALREHQAHVSWAERRKVSELTQPPHPHPHHGPLSSFWVIFILDPVRLLKRPQIRVLWRNRINRRIIYMRERFYGRDSCDYRAGKFKNM